MTIEPNPDSRCHRAWVMLQVFSLTFIVILTLGSEILRAQMPTDASPSTVQRQPVSSFGKLPLSFEPNQGQFAEEIDFLTRGPGYALALSANEAALALETGRPSKMESGKAETPAILHMRLMGAHFSAPAEGVDELPGKTNYFVGNDPKRWRTNVPNFARVQYRRVYPGIDLVYYGNRGQLEYDFVVAPGSDPGAIRLAIDGASPKIDSGGDLVLRTGDGEVRFHQAVAYQRDAQGRRLDVAAHYVVQKEARSIAFRIAAYDHALPLIIDPTLTYSTYLGGSQGDVGYGIAVDSSGNSYIAGQTCSTNFPTGAPYQAANAGQCDAFVTKLNSAGTALVYSTYLGGSGGDQASGIAIDSSGNAYVTGITNSTDFPVTAGSFQPAYGGGDADDFVTELNASGSALVYSSYLGGTGTEGAGGIAVDRNGNAYLTGETDSVDFPVSFAAFQPFYAGNKDAFVTKVNAGGASLGYSSYLGSDGGDAGTAIAVDNLGSAFVTGSTFSDDSSFPVANTTAQAACGGYKANGTPPVPPNCPPYILGTAFTDAFITKVSPDGSSLVYSTYLGGSGNDVGTGIAVDSLGAAYVTGWTVSSDFRLPINGQAFQPALAGGVDAFVAKLDPQAAQFVYSTYLGGSGQDQGTAIAVDLNGVAYVTGGTTSSNFPTVSAIQPTLSGPLNYPGDAFVCKVNAYGSGLIYSSFLGGGDLDVGNAIAVDSSLAVYVTGSTASTDFPATKGIFQDTAGGAGDAFVTKLNALTAAVAALSSRSLQFGSQPLGIPSPPQTVTITNSGDASLVVSSIVESGDIYQPPPSSTGVLPPPVDLQDWSIASDQCTGVSVPPGGTCTFQIVFDPNPLASPAGLGVGARTGTITLTDNATTPTQLVALSGTGVAVPAAQLAPASLAFPNEPVGKSSPTQTVTLSNTGGSTLAISSVQIVGDFSETSTCGSSLGAGLTCTFTITFTPTTAGDRAGTLSVNDDAAGSPQTAALTGTGTAPVATISPTTLNFGGQSVGTTSAVQTVTLTNTGNQSLSLTSVTVTGKNAGDFTQSNTCASTIAAGSSCTVNVTFTPTAAGTRTANLTFTDNGPGSPQVASLGGIGADFAMVAAPASVSTLAGNAAAYTATVTPQNGFSGKVTFTCSNLPPLSTCSASPASITEDGSTPMTATITVNTTVRSGLWRGPGINWPRPLERGLPPWTLWALALILAALALGARRRTRWRLAGLAALMLLIATWAACSGTPSASAAGTPAGSYMITVSGASGPVSHNASVNLQVQ